MTSGAAGAAINPERYIGFEQRFDAYIKSVGGASIAFDIWTRLTDLGVDGLAMRHALLASSDQTSLWVRTLPDRLVARKGFPTILVEIKAHETDNLAITAVPFFYALKQARTGCALVYVAVPPRGAFLLSTPQLIAERRRTVYYSPTSSENAECRRLLVESGLTWDSETKTPRVGQSDPYFLVKAAELKSWRVLRDSAGVPAVRTLHSTTPTGGTSARWASGNH